MDRRSWLWRRKSSEKSQVETESSGSVSSISERFSDDQEALRASPNNAQSPDISSKIASHEVDETVKSLNEKLSAALSSLSAKEDLVKQHTKVAEEAVAGWEKAENEVAALKQLLEATAQKNSALENRIGHLDGALKECVRQFRQSREEQEQKLNDTLTKKRHEWESQKLDLETRITELQAQLEARNDLDHQLKFHDLEKGKSTLKVELNMMTLERGLSAQAAETASRLHFESIKKVAKLEAECRRLSTQAAETASRQHLESIKKVAKLEAECRRLRAAVKRSSPLKDINKTLNSSVDSIADNQSDSCSESWASALVVEVDQSKNDKVMTRNLTSSIGIDLMDDFLEMERFAALPEANHANANFSDTKENPSTAEFEALKCKIGELEEEVEKMTTEKQEVEIVLSGTRDQLKVSYDQLIVAEDKFVEMQQKLNSANGSKHAFEKELDALESKKKEMESQLKAKIFEVRKLREKVGLLESKHQNVEQMEAQLKSEHMEVEKLRKKVGLLEREAKEKRTLSAKLAAKCQNVEIIEAERIGLESKLISARLEGEELQGTVSSLEAKLKEQMASSAEFTFKVAALEDEREALRTQLEIAHLEASKLREKMSMLVKEVEVESALSSDLATKCKHLEALEAKKEEKETRVKLLEEKAEEEQAFKSQLELAHLEVRKLCEKVDFQENEIEEKRRLSAEFAAKCESLKDELVRTKRELELQLRISSTGEMKIRQEREFAVASENFAECQTTIASLSRQLNLLKDFDLMLEHEEPELDAKANYNALERSLRPSSASSPLPEFGNCASRSSFIHIQSVE